MNTKSVVILTIMCVVMMGLSVLPSGVDGAGTGFFNVLVVSSSEVPIENAIVWIDDEVTWTTQKDGRCTFRDVDFGNHTLTVLADGYKPASMVIDFQKNASEYKFTLNLIKPVTKGIIKGRVFLDVYDPPYDAGESMIGFETSIGAALPGLVDVHTTSDPLIGEYYTLVAPGDHFLWCFAYGHVPMHSGAITVLAGEVVYYDFHLKYTGMHNSGLAGNVTDVSDGSPIAGATVIATDGTTTLVTSTDTYGFYFFIGPNAGTYTLIAASSSYEPGTASGTVNWGQITYVDIELKKGTENRTILWGFVYGDGIPLSTATVFTDVPHTVNSNVLGIAGLYAIMDFPGDEDHLVGAMASGYYPVSTLVNVPTGTIYRQDLYMQKGKERYAVVIASSWEKTTGNAIDNSTIMLNNPGVFSDTQSTGPSTNVHVWVGIPAWGSYSVNCVRSGYIFVDYSISPGTGIHPPSATFTLSTTTVNHLKLFMNKTDNNEKTNIWGYVTIAGSSLPLSGCPILDITGVMTPFSTTDPTGFYLEYVSPSTYTLVALPPTGYSLMNYDHATGVWGWGPWTGTVSLGESRHVDFMIKEDKESMVIAGQVVMQGTGDPVAGFDLEAMGPSTPTLYATTPSSGFFIFSPLWGPGNWTLNGHHPSLFVTDVEYWLLMSGPHSNSPTLPIMFGLTIPNVMWVRITVQKEVPQNSTRIWGYVYTASIGGTPIPSCGILEMTGTATLFSTTDVVGHYNEIVSPGNFTLMPLAVGGYSIQSYDWGTGAVSIAPWSGTVIPGESRHVDFIMKQDREAAIIAGQVIDGTGDPVPGFNIGLSSGSLNYNSVTPASGLFISPPIYLFSTWQVSGFHPSYVVVEVNYHLFPGGAVSTSTSLPVSFPLSSSNIMWVEITVKEGQQGMARLYGKVYKLFSYAPASGAAVKIYQMPGTILTYTLTADATGYYEQVLLPGDYYVKASLSGYGASSATVTLLPGDNIYQPFYLMPKIPIPLPLNLTMRFVQKDNGTPIKDLNVEMAGIAKGRTDQNGEVKFSLPEAGEYSIYIAAAHAVIYDPNGNELGSLDGPVKLESNGTYTVKVSFYQRIEITKAPRKAEGIGIPPLAGVGILLAALLIGAVVGYAIKRPKTHDIEE